MEVSLRHIIPFLVFTLFTRVLIAQDNVIEEESYTKSIELTNGGWDSFAKGEYDQAIGLFTEALKIYDGNTDTWLGRATAYSQKEQYDLAKDDVDKAIQLSPSEADVYYLGGNVLMKSKLYHKAALYYSRAIEYNPTSNVKVNVEDCYYNRGNAYLMTEKLEMAVADFTAYIESNLDNPAGYHNRGVAFKKLGIEDKACADFKAALDHGSDKSARYMSSYCK